MSLSVADLRGTLTLDDGEWRAKMSDADQSVDRFVQRGDRLKEVGSSWNKNVTLPLAAAGLAAFKVGADFDTAMSRIVGLVGVAGDEVDAMRGDVLELSGETTKSPQELADALFTITSAGLRGGEAMEVLEQSAKASAAGLGETRAIAEAVTASINTYGSEVLSASQATDIFVATARAGNFATEDLTAAMGQVLPFAQAAGASLEDVGGAVALLTRSNNDANASITQVASMMRAFVRPSQQALDILDDLGMSSQDVRDHLGEHGLVATLQMLDGAMGGNREQLGRLIEDSEGFAAAIQILDADAATLESTFGVTADAAGMTGEAFEAFADSAGFTATKAFAELHAALIKVGDIIIPLASDLLGFAGDTLGAFAQLPDPVLKTAIAMAAVAAAVGPLMTLGGNLMLMMRGLKTAMETLAPLGQALARSFRDSATGAVTLRSGARGLAVSLGAGAGLAGAITVATMAWQQHQQRQAEVEAAQRALTDAMRETNGELRGSAEEMVRTRATEIGLTEALNELEISYEDFMGALSGGDDAWNAFVDNALAAAMASGASRQELVVLEDQLSSFRNAVSGAANDLEQEGEFTEGATAATGEMTDALGTGQEAMEGMGGAAEGTGEEIESLTEAVDAYNDALTALFDPLFGMVDALQANQDAAGELMMAEGALQEAIREHGEGSTEAAEAQRDLEDAHRTSTDSALELEQAARTLEAAIQDGNIQVADARAMLDHWVESGIITRETANRMARKFDDAAGSASNMSGDYPVNVRAPGLSSTLMNVRLLSQHLDGLHGRNIMASINVQMNAPPGIGTGAVSSALSGGPTLHEGGHIPGPRGAMVPFRGLGGEEVLATDDPRNSANWDMAALQAAADRQLAGPNPAVAAGAMGAGSGGGGAVVVELRANDRLGAALIDSLSHEVTRRGGSGPDSVQVALGRRH